MTVERGLLQYVVRMLTEREIEYFITGSVAAMRYGEARLTRDIDIVVQLRPEHIAGLVSAFQLPDFYLEQAAIRDALTHHGSFNAIHIPSGMKIDFMCPKSGAFTDSRFSRSRVCEVLPGLAARISSAEDVILMKLKYFQEGGSDKHLRDIASMFRISGTLIDQTYLTWWAPILGVQAEFAAVLDRLPR